MPDPEPSDFTPKRRPGRPPGTARVEETTRRVYTEPTDPSKEPGSDIQGRIGEFEDVRHSAKTYRIDDKGNWSFLFACEPSGWSESLTRDHYPDGGMFAVIVIDREKRTKGNIVFRATFRMEASEAPPADNPAVELLPEPPATPPNTLHDFLMLTIEQMRISHDERMKAQADREKSFTSMVTQIMPLVTRGSGAQGDDLDRLVRTVQIMKDLKSGDDLGSVLQRMKELDELKDVVGAGAAGADDFSWASVLKGLAKEILPRVLPLLSRIAATVPPVPGPAPSPALQLNPSPMARPPAPGLPPQGPAGTPIKANGEDKASKSFSRYIPILIHAIESEDVDYAVDWITTLLESQGATPAGQELIRYAFLENTFDTLAAKHPEIARQDFKEVYDRISAELRATSEPDPPGGPEIPSTSTGDPGDRTDDPRNEKPGN